MRILTGRLDVVHTDLLLRTMDGCLDKPMMLGLDASPRVFDALPRFPVPPNRGNNCWWIKDRAILYYNTIVM